VEVVHDIIVAIVAMVDIDAMVRLQESFVTIGCEVNHVSMKIAVVFHMTWVLLYLGYLADTGNVVVVEMETVACFFMKENRVKALNNDEEIEIMIPTKKIDEIQDLVPVPSDDIDHEVTQKTNTEMMINQFVNVIFHKSKDVTDTCTVMS